jgi:FHS family L-fucose permease-like MFS transporter
MWGMAASMNDILITQFKAVFALSDLASAFVQSAFTADTSLSPYLRAE